MSNTQSLDTNVSSNSTPDIFIRTKVKIYGDPKALAKPFNVLVKANLFEGDVFLTCRHAAGSIESLELINDLEDKAISRLLSSIANNSSVQILREQPVEKEKSKSASKRPSSKSKSSTTNRSKTGGSSKAMSNETEIKQPSIQGQSISGEVVAGDIFNVPSSDTPDDSLKATYQDILQNKGLTENDFPEVDFSNRHAVKSFIASHVD